MKRNVAVVALVALAIVMVGTAGCRSKPKPPDVIQVDIDRARQAATPPSEVPGAQGPGTGDIGITPLEQPPQPPDARTWVFDPDNPRGLKPIFFEFDKSRLTPEARKTLEHNAEILKQHPDIRVRIEGHCDERGTIEYNLALGERRALSARNYLINLGIEPERLATISFGEERPADPRHNEEAWAKNRRDEFVAAE